MLNGVKSLWTSVSSAVPQGLILGPILFNCFINILGDGQECTFSKFTDDVKLLGATDRPECGTLHSKFDKLEKWADRDLMKVNKGKCKVLQLGRNNLRHPYELAVDQLERSFSERDLLGFLVDTKLNMNQSSSLHVGHH